MTVATECRPPRRACRRTLRVRPFTLLHTGLSDAVLARPVCQIRPRCADRTSRSAPKLGGPRPRNRQRQTASLRNPAVETSERMKQPTTPEQPKTPAASLGDRARNQRFRAGAALVVVLAIALILWLALRDTGGGISSSNAGATVSAMSERQIKNLAAAVGHQIYWLGPKQGYTYELTQNPNGSIILRYLPPGAKVGASQP